MASRVLSIANHLLGRDPGPAANPGAPGSEPEPRAAVRANPHLVGNFAPTGVEGHWDGLEVVGEIPPNMTPGMFLRVGPNPRFSFEGKPYHVFDGDGFVHAVAFPSGGRAPSYTRRFVRTRRLVTSERRGFDVAELGEQAFGRFDYVPHVVDNDPDSPEPGHRMGKANTNLVTYAGHVYALEEADKPYMISTSWDGESNLRTVGRWDFHGKLTHEVTAHPKVDPVTGELLMFCYSPIQPRAMYAWGDAAGNLVHSFQVDLPAPVMMHDMIITDRHSVLFDMRLEFSMENLQNGANPWVHRKDVPARFGVMPRHAKSQDELAWIDVAPCGVFHFANAWVEPDGHTLVVVGSRLVTVNFNQYEDKVTREESSPAQGHAQVHAEARAKDEPEQGRLHEWRLDLRTRKCVAERVVSEHQIDFCQIDPARTGRKSRFVYAAHFETDKAKLPRAEYKDSLFVIKGLVKFDLEAGKQSEILYTTADGRQAYGGEAVFVPFKDRDPADEDAGCIVVIVHDEKTQLSDACVFRAKDLSLAARVHLKLRVPYGFHSTYTTAVR